MNGDATLISKEMINGTNNRKIYHINTVKEANIDLKIGDLVIVDDHVYFVDSCIVTATPWDYVTRQYVLCLLEPFADDCTVKKEITITQKIYNRQEEISEETRNKFLSLLE